MYKLVKLVKSSFLPPVVTDVCRPRRFPPLCGSVALWGSWTVIALAGGVSVWAGRGFTQNVSTMWLVSCFASFLCSCLLLEPMKVGAHWSSVILVSSPGRCFVAWLRSSNPFSSSGTAAVF